MNRLLFAFWVATVLSFGLAGLGGSALGVDLADYYPLDEDAVGNVLVYVEQEEGQQQEQLREVAVGALDFDGRTGLLIGEMEPGCWAFAGEALGWSSESLVFFGEIDCDQGQLESMIFADGLDYLPRSLEVGQVAKREPIQGVQTEVRLEATESATVAAGEFEDCIKLRVRFEEGDDIEECQSWYARGVGMVKSICEETSDGQTIKDTEELATALIDGQLIGNPLQKGEVVAFDLATAETSGCGMLIRNIVLEGGGRPELWWAGFVFNEESLKWELSAVGTSEAQVPQRSCSLAGLDFAGVQTTVRRDDMSGKPVLNMFLPLGGKRYALGFVWNLSTLSWDYGFSFELEQ